VRGLKSSHTFHGNWKWCNYFGEWFSIFLKIERYLPIDPAIIPNLDNSSREKKIYVHDIEDHKRLKKLYRLKEGKKIWQLNAMSDHRLVSIFKGKTLYRILSQMTNMSDRPDGSIVLMLNFLVYNCAVVVWKNISIFFQNILSGHDLACPQ
jgi:hypothetical protein